jgi:hypothetical protein
MGKISSRRPKSHTPTNPTPSMPDLATGSVSTGPKWRARVDDGLFFSFLFSSLTDARPSSAPSQGPSPAPTTVEPPASSLTPGLSHQLHKLAGQKGASSAATNASIRFVLKVSEFLSNHRVRSHMT